MVNIPIQVQVIIIVAIVLLFTLQTVRVKFMINADMKYREYGPNGNLLKEGRTRNRWDYSIFPFMTRGLMRVNPKTILTTIILFGLIIVWKITDESAFLDLTKVSLGAFLAALTSNIKELDEF